MTSKDPFNELADGFLSSPEFPGDAPSAGPTTHRVTLDRDRRTMPSEQLESVEVPGADHWPPLELQILFPGNLPVWANLWLPDYARRVADERGPVALLHLRYKSCSVQVFGGPAGVNDVPEEACTRITDLAQWIVHNVSRVVIVPRAVDDDEAILETELPIMIMTGADEAAKIEAYRRSKELVESSRNAELQPPELGLIIAGTNNDDARVIASRISETAARFLQFDLPLERVIPAMGPASEQEAATSVGLPRDVEVGPTYDTERLVAELRRASLDRGSSGVPTNSEDSVPPIANQLGSAPAPEEILAKLENDTLEPATSEELSGILEPLPAAPMTESPSPFVPASEHPLEESVGLDAEREAIEARFQSATSIIDAPEQTVESTPLVIEETAALEEPVPTIAGYAELIPSLDPIDLPCITDPRIELGLDEAGRLHLVADESSLRGLRAAEAWATQNWKLLDLVLKGRLASIQNERHGIRFDVVVRDAAASSDLHGTGLLLHLLIETDGSERFTVPLNNEKTAFLDD